MYGITLAGPEPFNIIRGLVNGPIKSNYSQLYSHWARINPVEAIPTERVVARIPTNRAKSRLLLAQSETLSPILLVIHYSTHSIIKHLLWWESLVSHKTLLISDSLYSLTVYALDTVFTVIVACTSKFVWYSYWLKTHWTSVSESSRAARWGCSTSSRVACTLRAAHLSACPSLSAVTFSPRGNRVGHVRSRYSDPCWHFSSCVEGE